VIDTVPGGRQLLPASPKPSGPLRRAAEPQTKMLEPA